MARCELTDLPEDMCAHCKGVDGPQPLDDYELQGVFHAKFNGECYVDGAHRIIKGDEISEVVRTDRPSTARLFACRQCTKNLVKRRNLALGQ